jgi:hypothetical protein
MAGGNMRVLTSSIASIKSPERSPARYPAEPGITAKIAATLPRFWTISPVDNPVP